MTIKIDPEFKALIPALSSDELTQLESNLVAWGSARDPLVVWDGILIDGHNRFEICTRRGLSFTTSKPSAEFADRDAAMLWIIDNQNGRRNLPPFVKITLAEKRRDILAKQAKERQIASRAQPGEKIGAKRSATILSEYEYAAKHPGAYAANVAECKVVQNSAPPYVGKARDQVAAAAGVSHNTVDKARFLIANAPAALKEQLNKNETTIHAAYVATKKLEALPEEDKAKVVEAIEQGAVASEAIRSVLRDNIASRDPGDISGKHRIVYADPPWSYGNSMPPGTSTPADYYPPMSTEEICKLPVKDAVDDDAVLFLWTTSPHLEESFQVIKAWGFAYKTSFIWDKVKHNMGHYNSVRHEFLLVCTRGACTPDVRKLYDSVVTEERTEHSKKPKIFYEMIDTLYPHGSRIELFSRYAQPGWKVWGFEAPHVAA